MLSGSAPDATVTGPDGKATRTYLFNTYSGAGILHADRCDAKLLTVEIVLVHTDYRVQRVALKKPRVRPQAVGSVASIVIPPVLVDPLGP